MSTSSSIKVIEQRPNQVLNKEILTETQEVNLYTQMKKFRSMMHSRLDDSNFKSLAYKQDEFVKLMYSLTSEFNMFYLLEDYSEDFNASNLAIFVKRLAFIMCKNKNEEFKIPQAIKNLLTKLAIKHLPHMDPIDCFIMYQHISVLQFSVEDPFAKSIMQILKYHVNNLDLYQLFNAKWTMLHLKSASKSSSVENNSYVENLEKAFNLAAQLRYKDMKTPKEAVKLLNNYGEVISENNFELILKFINKNHKLLTIDYALELLRFLEKRNYKHLELLRKITTYLIRFRIEKLQECNLKDFRRILDVSTGGSNEEKFLNLLRQFQTAFLALQFYDTRFLDFYVNRELGSANFLANLQFILKNCIYFQHFRPDLLETLLEKSLIEKAEIKLSAGLVLVYAGLIKFNK